MEQMRLQKYLAQAGIASRRKAEEMIRQGRVRVDGVLVTEMGTKVSADSVVEVDGKRVGAEEKKVYVMLNKPVGYVSTSRDQFSRPAVVDLVKDVGVRLHTVGRLDYDTSGLLLMTNDGKFTYRLTHPKHQVKKVYVAEIEGIPSTEDMQAFKQGLNLDGYITAQAEIRILSRGKNSSVAEIVIHEGKNRQVRRMCEAIGHPVIKLKRIAIGNLKLGNLPEGKWRYLKDDEIRSLMEISHKPVM
jgi:23S rRNA pseudouridine2605 synthase